MSASTMTIQLVTHPGARVWFGGVFCGIMAMMAWIAFTRGLVRHPRFSQVLFLGLTVSVAVTMGVGLLGDIDTAIAIGNDTVTVTRYRGHDLVVPNQSITGVQEVEGRGGPTLLIRTGSGLKYSNSQISRSKIRTIAGAIGLRAGLRHVSETSWIR